MTSLIIAIDGPSASGKGTIAQKLANHFKLPYLNSGALYRALSWHIKQKNIDPTKCCHYLEKLVKLISEDNLNNENIMTEEIGAIASIIAKNNDVRNSLLSWQQDFIKNSKLSHNGCVIDGRDITTVICPDANYKFYITANVEIRAKRRFTQLQKKEQNINYQIILDKLKQRDYNDINRSQSPLKIATDAIIIDNSHLDIDQTFAKIIKYISCN